MTHLRTALLLAALAGLLAGCNDTPSNPAGASGDQSTTPPELKAPDPMTAQKPAGPEGPIWELQQFAVTQKVDKTKSNWKETLPKPPVVTFPEGHTWYWNLTTNVGDVKVKLLPAVAPMHVSSTIYLTKLGYYDGISFHRVITDFMAQGGCPRGQGNGGPGYQYAGEFDPAVRHDKGGLLSMANAGPGTDGSQFFLTFKATPWLDGKHTIFGEVVEGMDAVRALEANGSPSGKPKQPLSIQAATITFE